MYNLCRRSCGSTKGWLDLQAHLAKAKDYSFGVQVLGNRTWHVKSMLGQSRHEVDKRYPGANPHTSTWKKDALKFSDAYALVIPQQGCWTCRRALRGEMVLVHCDRTWHVQSMRVLALSWVHDRFTTGVPRGVSVSREHGTHVGPTPRLARLRPLSGEYGTYKTVKGG